MKTLIIGIRESIEIEYPKYLEKLINNGLKFGLIKLKTVKVIPSKKQKPPFILIEDEFANLKKD